VLYGNSFNYYNQDMSLGELQESPYIDIHALGIVPENAGKIVEHLRGRYGNKVDDAIGMIIRANEFTSLRSSRFTSNSYQPSPDDPMDIVRFLYNMGEESNLKAALRETEQGDV
jgi:hypothetical protein